MAAPDVLVRPSPFLSTHRRDAWWAGPGITLVVFGSFILYATWAALQGDNYTFGPYLSPMYSPELFGSSPHAIFGPKPDFWPSWLPFSPAILILWAPGGFRLTCYYYRGAYYKAFWGDPPACAVGEPRKGYRGEKSFPLVYQNIHRYFMYLALAFLVVLAYDAYKATQFPEGFGVGLGTLVLTVNVVLLGSYTFGCHSFRHLIGGRKDSLPTEGIGAACYNCASAFNRRHMLFAWLSLVWVAFSDVYIRMCAMGVWSDWRIF